MNKTKIYMRSGNVSVLPVIQSGKEKSKKIYWKKNPQQFQFKSVKYILQFKHGIQIIQ